MKNTTDDPTRCTSRRDGDQCVMDLGHTGIHSLLTHTWWIADNITCSKCGKEVKNARGLSAHGRTHIMASRLTGKGLPSAGDRAGSR